ncbi:MAG: Ig-like domain-containing protein [Erythrobacter sp.]
MMDFDGRSQGSFEPENQDEFSNELLQAQATAAAQAGLGAERVVQPGPDNIVTLPAEANLEGFSVDGRDLIITLEDGSVIRIPDGAIVVPQFVIDGVSIPPQTVAALLTGNEPEPEAGNPQSSGGNFAGDVGDIQAAYALGDLLPYTELSRPQYTDEEIIPGLVDKEPGIIVITPDNPVGAVAAIATVDEEGLPSRTIDGVAEAAGTAWQTDAETTTGTIAFDAPDGAQAVLINGVAITAVGQTFTSPFGTLTITSIDLAGGQIGFSYTLGDNLLGGNTDDFFTMTVVDTDGDEASATLTIEIIDDQPIATSDFNSVPGATFGPVTGNVLVNDVPGADGYGADGAVTGFSGAGGNAAAGATLTGTYGELTLNADGSYSYTRFVNTPGGVTDEFTYSIVDGDGSTATATLTINIADAPNDITFVPETGAGTLVDEGQLPSDTDTRTDEPEGSAFDGDPEATTGTITFVSPDGVASVSIGGTVITPDSLPQTVSTDGTGTLVVTGYSYDPATGVGSITYVYTLTDNTGDTDNTILTFPIVVTDLDDDTATDDLVITIVDDSPTAVDDSATQATENASVTVDVMTNDTTGADGVDLATGVSLVAGTLSGAGTLTYNGDGTFTYVPGPGEEAPVTFDYTITDGDGDTSTATVTIDLLEDSTPSIAVEGDNDVDEAALGARPGEPEGSNAASDGETATGVIDIATGNDTIASLVINGVDVTNGGTVTTADGVLTITVTNGAYSYSYTLSDNTLSDPDSDSFSLTVTDSDGDTASTALVIAIIDDNPSALDDAGSIASGSYGPIGGNVLANDTQGADAATVTSYTGTGGGGATGEVIQGTYGTLTIAADGTYSYTRDAGTPGGVTDTFSYTITDGDGDTATANLVISIGNSTTTLDLPTTGEAGTLVEEAGLAGPPAGSDAAGDGEFTSGTFTYTAPDGPAAVTIDGVEVTTVGQTFTGTYGTMTITAIAPGSISYTYELTTNTSGDSTFDGFDVVVTDQDGDFTAGTLQIDIVDDVPTASPDSDSVTEDGPLTADGNLLTGSGGADTNTTDGVADVTGADGASVTGVASGTQTGPVTGNVGGSVAGTYGSLQVSADGDYVYTLDNTNALVQGLDQTESLTETFTYTITDGDGDTATTTVTITINGQDDPVVINDLFIDEPEGLVDEDDLTDGSDTTPESTTTSGTFSVDAQDGLETLTIGGTSVFGSGVTYPVVITGDYGTLRITGVTPVTDANGDTVSLTVNWEFELGTNTLDHTVIDAQDSLFDSFDVVATDSDGSSASSVLDIEVVDDVPTANDDGAVQATENQSFTIDALGNDVFGADGVDTTDIADVFVSTQAGQGTVTYDPVTGLFTYTPAPGAGSGGNTADFFEYTIVDGDGDTSTARVDVTLQPDSEPTGSERLALLDDDGLAGGNPLSTADDLDANVDDLATDNDESSYSGLLAFNVGNDTPAAISFDPALNGSTAAVGQETVTYSVVGNVLTATVTGGDRDGTDLFTVEITDSATGAYTVTLLDNVVHDAGNDENNAAVSLDFLVTDSDGDTTFTNLAIVFDDDAPTATNNDNEVDEGAIVGGNLLTDDDGAGVDASGADGYGANGAVIALESVTFGGSTTTVDASGNLVISTTLGTLTVNAANGSYTYQSNSNSTNADAVDVFTYTIVDGDGDEVSATLTIDVTNAPGQVSDNDVLVNEAGLASGSSPLDGTQIDTDGQINVIGATGTLVYSLDGAVAGPGANEVQIDGTYGTIVLNTQTGAYTYTLDTPFTDAVDENTTNLVNGAESFTYEVHDDLGNLIGTSTIVVNIIDDVPTATDDANSVTEGLGNLASGNVYDAVGASAGDTADTIGADVPGAGTEVTGVRTGEEAAGGALTAVGGATVVVGTYGNLTINPDGSYSYALTVAAVPVGATETFTYQITDNDGDTDLAELVITIDQDLRVPDIAGSTATVYEDGLADGVQHGVDSETATGSFLVTDNDEGVTFTLTADNGNTLSDPAVNDTLTTSVGVLTITGIVDNGNGTVTYSYSYTLSAALTHTGQGEVNDLTDTITMAISDDTGDSDTTPGTIVISIVDDIPVATSDTATMTEDDASVSGNVVTDPVADEFGADGAASPAVTAISGFNGAGTVDGNTVGEHGTLVLNNDGSYTYTLTNAALQGLNDGESETDTFTYTIMDSDGDISTATLVITINGANDAPALTADSVAVSDEGLANGNPDNTGNLDTTDLATASGQVVITDVDDSTFTTTLSIPTETLAVADGSVSGASITWALSNNDQTLTGTINGGTETAIVVTIDNSGNFTVTQSLPIFHSNTSEEDDTSFTIDVSANDGATTTTLTDAITVSLEDDSPVAVVADSMTATNAVGTYTADLDADDNVSDNYGGDGGRVIFTQDSITALEGQNLTSGLDTLEYSISTDGTVLTAVTSGGTPVFTITLDPDGANDNMYVLDLQAPLDAVTDVDFSDGGYDFLGGNTAWTGFNQPGTNDSLDLLLTPLIGGVEKSTVNTSDIAGGVGNGNSLGTTDGQPETMRISFVQDLTGNNAGSGGYQNVGNHDHSFEQNRATNGASALFTSSSGTRVNIAAIDDGDNDNDLSDGTVDDITGIVISFGGADSGFITAADSGNPIMVGGETFYVYFNADGTVDVDGVQGTSGAQATGTRIAVYTDQQGLDVGETIAGYTTLEFTYVSGDQVKLGDFGATTQTNDPVPFTVPISVIDNDGDVVSSGNLDITLDPVVSSPAEPLVATMKAVPVSEPISLSGSDFLGASQGTQSELRALGTMSLAAAASGLMMDFQISDFGGFELDRGFAGHGFEMPAFQAIALAASADTGGSAMGGIEFTGPTVSVEPAPAMASAGFEGFDFTPMSGLLEFAQGHASGFAVGEHVLTAPVAFESLAAAIPMADAMGGMEALLLLGDMPAAQAPADGLALAGDPAAALADLGAESALDMAIDYFATGEPLGGASFGGGMGGDTFLAGMLDAHIGPLHAAGMGHDIVQDAALVLETANHA